MKEEKFELSWSVFESATNKIHWCPIAPGINCIINERYAIGPDGRLLATHVDSGVGILDGDMNPEYFSVHSARSAASERERITKLFLAATALHDPTLAGVHEELVKPSQLRRSVFEQASTLGLGQIAPFVPEAILAPVVQKYQVAYGARLLAEEAGEVLKPIKRWIDYGMPLDRDKLLDELGDVLFTISFIAEALGWTLGDVASAQIEKIKRNFGARWTRDQAVQRTEAKGERE